MYVSQSRWLGSMWVHPASMVILTNAHLFHQKTRSQWHIRTLADLTLPNNQWVAHGCVHRCHTVLCQPGTVNHSVLPPTHKWWWENILNKSAQLLATSQCMLNVHGWRTTSHLHLWGQSAEGSVSPSLRTKRDLARYFHWCSLWDNEQQTESQLWDLSHMPTSC